MALHLIMKFNFAEVEVWYNVGQSARRIPVDVIKIYHARRFLPSETDETRERNISGRIFKRAHERVPIKDVRNLI